LYLPITSDQLAATVSKQRAWGFTGGVADMRRGMNTLALQV
tara:strand:+ start:1091 stop:1213 length:123 start_codon:yes stop_codon:yes gene_type:complete